MKKYQYPIFGFILTTMFFVVIYFNNKTENEKIKINLENMKFKFSGVVTDKKELYSATGLVYVDVKASTTSEYDIRRESVYYSCVLKNSKAEIIEVIYKVEIGDSMVVDGYNKKNIVYRNGKKMNEWNIWMGDYKPFYSGIRKYHKIH